MAISQATDRVGQVLGGRYRLLGPIGTGASATVYLADDVVLRRRVAVKVLHAALAEDSAFLERFRAEAQAAASLNHPHVMAVHDWGQGDVPFLVTELLGGGSLRALLDEGHLLDPAQARRIGVEAARALDYAHRRGFVHRDIKPANLLFDDEGRLCIADFGLARALAEAAWTEPMGAVLGTVRYASPEQAQGATLDGRSDVYSLGLVLIEAVTGEVPFTADTALGTLMARVDRAVPVPPALGPLTTALAAAGRPDPAERPDAGAFATLLMAAGDLGPVADLPLAGTATIDPALLEPKDPTTLYVAERKVLAAHEPEIMAAPPGTTTDGITIVSEGAEQPPTTRIDRPTDEPRIFDVEADDDDGGVPVEVLATDSAPRRRRRRVALVVALVALLAAAGVVGGLWLTRTPTHVLGNFAGQSATDVEAHLRSDGLKVTTTQQYSDTVGSGDVISQDPAPGTTLKEGASVALVVSQGPEPVAVPQDLGGHALDEATRMLAAAGLKVGDITRKYDENWSKDVVLALGDGTPAQLPKGSAVPLVVSNGPEPRTIPDGLVGQSADAVTQKLESMGLKVVRDGGEYSKTVPAGNVLKVTPPSGQQLDKGGTVTLTVSNGPPVVVIPSSIVGLDVDTATTKLENLGLVVAGITGNPRKPVTGSTPAVGTTVQIGSSVTLLTN